jgi:hypothetical protein
MELNRGGLGIPLHKLAHVVDEAQRFFRMLGEDVRIPKDRGEWIGFDFDNKSLNFTAEYVGPVTPEQVKEFYAAFDGVTLLRRGTIAQFARIADAIGEDELIGFGLYQNDYETQPSEWRSLSKREALRITEDIRLLLDRAGGAEPESRIPAALDPNAAAMLFKDRRDHGGGIDALTQRVEKLEAEVAGHDDAIQGLRGTTANTEKNLQNLLVAVDAFCEKASKQMERLPAPEPRAERTFAWRIPVAVAAVCALGAAVLFHSAAGTRGGEDRVEAARPAVRATPAPPPVEAPKPADPAPAPAPSSPRVELKAIEPAWIAISIDGRQTAARLLDAGQMEIIESGGAIRIRLGNAGGVEISANGKPVGPVGAKGQVRIVEFKGNTFRIVPL